MFHKVLPSVFSLATSVVQIQVTRLLDSSVQYDDRDGMIYSFVKSYALHFVALIFYSKLNAY